jgi:hypothetical protein
MSIALLHFQPLEQYPPVMNCICDLDKEKVTALKIFSTHSKNNWFSSSYPIYRLGNYTTSRWSRYWTYLYFNFACFFFLCVYRPNKVLYYETYSSWPVYFYKKLFPSVNVFIHFHEYISERERKESSAYYKYLHKKETVLLKKAIWISHTNEDRMRLFQQDFPFVRKDQCHILPNYPPADWQNLAQINKTNRTQATYQRIVYIGALGIKSTYIEAFAKWVHQQNGAYYFDIFSDNMEKEVMQIIAALESPFISIKQPINYFDLPLILSKYDIGVVLYTGHLPNYVYNVPNKVFEYLVCGLDVWYSKDLISTAKFQQDNKIENLKAVCFKDLVIMEENKTNQVPLFYSFSCEAIHTDILNDM